MKKFLLSTFVILAFIVYTIHEQFKGATNTNSALLPSTSATITPSNTPIPTQTPAGNSPPPAAPTATPTATPSKGKYKDGQYTGDSVDAYYGFVQVKAIIKNGSISDVQFLDHPQDRRTSQMINDQAMPYLTSEAIQAQSAQVDIVSGATDTSLAFRQSLQSALSKAAN